MQSKCTTTQTDFIWTANCAPLRYTRKTFHDSRSVRASGRRASTVGERPRIVGAGSGTVYTRWLRQRGVRARVRHGAATPTAGAARCCKPSCGAPAAVNVRGSGGVALRLGRPGRQGCSTGKPSCGAPAAFLYVLAGWDGEAAARAGGVQTAGSEPHGRVVKDARGGFSVSLGRIFWKETSLFFFCEFGI